MSDKSSGRLGELVSIAVTHLASNLDDFPSMPHQANSARQKYTNPDKPAVDGRNTSA